MKKTQSRLPRFEAGFVEAEIRHAEWIREQFGAGLANFLSLGKVDSERIAAERSRRLLLLFEHYNIAPTSDDRWNKLASALAEDLIAGFDVFSPAESRPQRGRPTSVDPNLYGDDLVRAVGEIDIARRKGIADACRLLSKREGAWKGIKPTTLSRRFSEALNSVRARTKKEASKN